jgi:hypothetical protein
MDINGRCHCQYHDIEIYVRARLEGSEEVLDILGGHADLAIPEIVNKF